MLYLFNIFIIANIEDSVHCSVNAVIYKTRMSR